MPTPILINALQHRDEIRRKAVDGLRSSFPMKLRDQTLELEDLKVHTRDFGPEDQKQAILQGTSLNEPVKGTVVLKDHSGNVVERVKNFTLMQLPYFTERHSFIVGGNEYQVANQIRMKPGVYTRKRANEEIETAFNLSKGSNFRLSLDEEAGVPYMKYETTQIPLYPVLRALGVPHTDIAHSWGTDLAAVNQTQFAKKQETAVDKLYKKVYRPQDQTHTTHDGRVQALHDAYARTSMDSEVNKITLGEAHDKVTPQAILNASKKLLQVYRSSDEVDDRDSLAFKTFHSVSDFVKERLQLDARSVASKVRLRATNKTAVRDILPSTPFSTGIRSFITGSQLSSIPTAINPVELIDHSMKVTSMGEGGIASERAVPTEARQVHSTHLGILDPVRTPESFSAGVDIRASLLTHRDEQGNLYTPVRDLRTGKLELLSAGRIQAAVVMFPHQPKTGAVEAMKNGAVTHVARAACTHEFYSPAQFYSPSANLLPLLESMQGNRATMASKHQTQALPLLQREAPLVQVGAQFMGMDAKTKSLKSFEHSVGHMIVPTAPVAGTVEKIDHQFIYIRPNAPKTASDSAYVSKEADDDLVKVPYSQHFPFASKTSLHHTIEVKPGQKVSEGEALGDSNYTINGTLALGKNLKTAYMAYYGLNSNDAIVISEAAAHKLTSEHMYREIIEVGPDTTLGTEIHRTYYGTKYTSAQYGKLDSKGVVRKGERLLPHDPFVVGVQKTKPSATDQLLGNIRRSLALPVREELHAWSHDFEGEVVDVFQSDRRVVVTIRTREPMRVGDKLSGRHGNKGVVSRIIPNDQMIQDAGGKPVDVIYTSQGVISRINPSQVLETALGKVAEKTGKPIVLENFTGRDNVQFAKDMLKKHGLADKETVYDPASGKKIPGVLVGPQYTLRLFKTTDSNFSARGTGAYDANQQPMKGGEDGAKGIGMLEFNGLLAHNARAVLKETATIKSQKNEDFWRALQLGLPLPKVHSPFAYNKFIGMLQGAGISVERRGDHLTMKPVVDRDVEAFSAGAIENEKLVKAKDLSPERGGLFDPVVTGGPLGTKWSHIDLAEPVVNPVFTDPARRLLGMTSTAFQALHSAKGGASVKKQLNAIELSQREKDLTASLARLKGADLDDAVKQIKYIRALNAQGLKAGDAYVLSKLPVLPPIMRPIMPTSTGGNLVVGDANELYRNTILHNKLLEAQNKDNLLPPDEHRKLRENLVNAVGAVIGTNDTDNPKMLKRNVKGFLEHLTGKTTPKSSFFQKKVMKRQQDASGRGTIAPDGALGMDQVGLPEEMLWEMFSKFVIARLVRQGFGAIQAKEMVEKRHPAARDALIAESRERPVMINRAPSLHRYNVVGAYALPTPGKTITVNPFIEKGMNADYDGDTFQVHAPIGHAAIEDVKKMTLSNLVFGDRDKDDLMVAPTMEAVLGLAMASKDKAPGGKTHKFQNKADAMAAYKRGDLSLQDEVVIG